MPAKKIIATRIIKPICMYVVAMDLIRIKRMNLESWMKHVESDNYLVDKYCKFECYHGLPDGWYLGTEVCSRIKGSTPETICWFQFNGQAYIEKMWWKDGNDLATLFRYNLSILNHKPLRSIEIESMRVLMNSRMLTKQQKSVFFRDQEYKNIASIKRYAYSGMKRLKELIKSKCTCDDYTDIPCDKHYPKERVAFLEAERNKYDNHTESETSK